MSKSVSFNQLCATLPVPRKEREEKGAGNLPIINSAHFGVREDDGMKGSIGSIYKKKSVL